MRALALTLIVMLAPACAQAEGRPRLGSDYRIDVFENAAAGRFDLRFVSLSSRELCLEMDTWPLDGSLTELWQGLVFVRTERGRYPMRGPVGPRQDAAYFNIARGERMDGYISYSAFPDAVAESGPHTLEYRAGVKFCDELSQ